jgi:hypothetical protein
MAINKPGRGVRQRGNQYERDIVNELKAMSFDAKTSRNHDRFLDSQGVDIVTDLPFNIQCKCLNNFRNPVPVLAHMPEDEKLNLIMSKVVSKGQYVTMSKEDFYRLLTLIHEAGIMDMI